MKRVEDKNPGDSAGQTPMDLALQQGHFDTFVLFTKYMVEDWIENELESEWETEEETTEFA